MSKQFVFNNTYDGSSFMGREILVLIFSACMIHVIYAAATYNYGKTMQNVSWGYITACYAC